jgi:hypothetical protein
MSNDNAARQVQLAWLSRVLGLNLPGVAAPDAAQLKRRLSAAGQTLQTLKAEGAPELPALLKQFAAATAGINTSNAAAQVDLLEATLALALSAARGREAKAANPRTVDSTKLRLRWRDAQQQVATSLTAIGQAVLARDDVKQDPRFAQVENAVKSLPLLLPKFGGELEALLDEAISAGSVQDVAKDALTTITTYRQKLAGAKTLLELELFAKVRLGGQMLLYGAIDQALGELADELALVA